jgi:hypothetical protein
VKPFEASCTVTPADYLTVKVWANGRLHVQCWSEGGVANSVVLSAKDEARLRRALNRREPQTGERKVTVCNSCNDTHWVDTARGRHMCTRCPVPCQRCRVGGNGAFCAATPCACACHVRNELRAEQAKGTP